MMSLVAAYGSSDEEEEFEEQTEEKPSVAPVQDVNKSSKLILSKTEETIAPLTTVNVNPSSKLQLPNPKEQVKDDPSDEDSDDIEDEDEPSLNFNILPEPVTIETNFIKEADSAPIPKKIDYDFIEKPPKKEKGPVKITIPSLSDFKDLEEENESKVSTINKPSQKGSGLIGLLPPPKGSIVLTKTTTMVPQVLSRKPIQTKTTITKTINKRPANLVKSTTTKADSDSEDDDDSNKASQIDFFSLTTSIKIPDDELMPVSNIDLNDIAMQSSAQTNTVSQSVNSKEEENEPENRLRSNVMNLPKEDILLKNKAEVGPKLPVPEQEYHVDAEGNVAFDEKAIEYLCGKRGVKRKQELSNIDIVEISGDDIKPDERDWLVKALTEEPVHRPISAGSGPGGQSKKKHQITYLAHQAKAMELELKNQWAQNKANRQQTRSKYGF